MTKKEAKKYDDNLIGHGEHFSPDAYRKIYSEVFLENICDELKISNIEGRASMKEAILRAASIYEVCKHNHLDWYKIKSVIETAMRDFHEPLLLATEAFEKIISHPTLQTHLMRHAIEQFQTHNFPQAMFLNAITANANEQTFNMTEVHNLLVFLTLSAQMAETKEDNNPAKTIGFAIEKWLEKLYAPWVTYSEITFTEGNTDNGYDKPAIHILTKLMKPLEKKIPKETIASAVKTSKKRLKANLNKQ